MSTKLKADPIELTMAWVQMPSLAVTPSVQTYASTTPGVVSYASGSRTTPYQLVVDHDGLVETYPELATRLEG